MNNISEMNKAQCCGCTACQNICPQNAITFKQGKETFLEPVIDFEKCINCGLCIKKCPQLNKIIKNNIENQRVYAVKNKNLKERKASSSGGMFSVLARFYLENDGIVFGVAFDDNLKVKHIAIDKTEDLYKLQGSKYIQSDLKNVFKEVKQHLNENKKILFVGTPCQIAGLKSFLTIDYDNLLLVDLVCHGVPSQTLFDKFIEWKEEQIGEKIEEFNFRDKNKKSWGCYSSIRTKSKTIYEDSNENPYYRAFLNGDIYRDCCYDCLYATEDRIGDITIADFWGCEDYYPKFTDKNGVSAVLINNEKGKKIFESIKKDIEYIETDIIKVKRKNHNLERPNKRNEIRKKAYNNLEDKNFQTIMVENLNYKYTFLDRVKKIMPNSLKKKIKKWIER